MPIFINTLEGHQKISLDTPIWRYLSFDRYIYLITSGNLWFSRIDKVGDRFEGSTTHASHKMWRKAYEQSIPREKLDETLVKHTETQKFIRHLAMANCWHASESEEMHMWKLYSDKNGIAIRSTPGDIGNALIGRNDVMINRVRYLDYSELGNDTISRGSFISQATSRPHYLEYENEVRLIVTNPELPSNSARFDQLPEGVGVAINSSKLITTSVIRPEAETWVFDVLEKIHSALGLQINLTISEFEFEPVW